MPKYLFIFGAGASFGSDTKNIPPTGSNLFDALRQFNPGGWGRIDSKLSDSFRSDFEVAMASINPTTLPPLQRVMADFFFRYQPTNGSLYYKLAQQIASKHWDGAMITLNYERLLEISLGAAGLNPFVGKPQNQAKPIELCFPHGCCHIFCKAARGAAQSMSFSGTNVTTNGDVEVIADPQAFHDRIVSDAFPPVMSYFEPQKRTTSCANFIEGQRARYLDLVANAERIAIVGLKVREHDIHIWPSLRETNAEITYCSGKTSGEEFKLWADRNRPKKANKILYSYFGNEFVTLLKEMNLIN